MRIPLSKDEEKNLLDAAQNARENSYSPYSKFKVGAAVLTEDNHIFAGTNIENASYGLTVCAERNAIFAAVGAGKRRFRALALITQKLPGLTFNSPCGACRQVMSEFKIGKILLGNVQGDIKICSLEELLPYGFDL